MPPHIRGSPSRHTCARRHMAQCTRSCQPQSACNWGYEWSSTCKAMQPTGHHVFIEHRHVPLGLHCAWRAQQLSRGTWWRHTCSNDDNLLQHMPKLEDLTIEFCQRLHVLPEAVRYLSMLCTLRIDHCTGLEVLPEWLGDLIALESMKIGCCQKLVSLLEGLRCLTALEELIVNGCSSTLTENCRKGTCKDWVKMCMFINN
jgi:hypothetical protein